MSDTYWLTYKIADKGDADVRRLALSEVVSQLAEGGKRWSASAAFYLFRSRFPAEDAVRYLASAIDPACDLVLLGRPDAHSVRVIGASADPELLALLPNAKVIA